MVHTYDQDMHNNSTNGGSHTVDEIFYKKISAFTVHTFSEDFSTLTTKFLDTSGSAIHTFVTAKSGPAPGPSPGPAPTPAPGPSPGPSPSGSSCKVYGCGKYAPEHKCQCNSYCKQHSDCCDDYDQVCGKGPSPAPSP